MHKIKQNLTFLAVMTWSTANSEFSCFGSTAELEAEKTRTCYFQCVDFEYHVRFSKKSILFTWIFMLFEIAKNYYFFKSADF